MSSLEYAIVLDFGYSNDRLVSSSIHDLARHVVEHYTKREGVMVLAQEETYTQLRLWGFPLNKLQMIKVGQSGTNGTSGGGSYHVLAQAKQIIIDEDFVHDGKVAAFPLNAMVVAHQLHVKRVIQQGKLLGFDLEAAEDLPTELYPAAAQWWCRSKPFWYLREFIGYIPLKLAGQL